MVSPKLPTQWEDSEMHEGKLPDEDLGLNGDLPQDATIHSHDVGRTDKIDSVLPETEEPRTSFGSERKFSTLAENEELIKDGLNIKPIGIVHSIYRLCVGTPRQGLLAPNARGYIDLFSLGNASPASSVDGLETFSHIWIVFIFHLNTVSEKSTSSSRRFKSKISPPAFGGEKVGIFATRSPHRFNPIGMTLCKLDRIEHLDQRNVRIHISGMDLVDGTPVVDIKPYVPIYDSVGGNDDDDDDDGVRLPMWVKEGLSLQRTVVVNDSARMELQSILTANPNALEFYGPSHGDETIDETMENVLKCIRQVLAMDVRSSYQTKRTRAGTFRAERSNRIQSIRNNSNANQSALVGDSLEISSVRDGVCTQQLDNLLIYFEAKESNSPRTTASTNSGAEDILFVTSIQLLDR